MRLDIYLFQNGFAESRARAKAMIENGCVLQNGKKAEKPSAEASEADKIEIVGETLSYVSRGALKLKAAFETFKIDANGLTAVDIGASTGGFTEYLLSAGAKKVYAVDSGINQLAAKLRADKRVCSMEKYNARNLCASDFDEKAKIAVMDVSFISQTLIIPSLCNVLCDRAVFVGLVKPQFEAGREAVGKGGIVKSAAARQMSLKKVIDCALQNGFELCGITESPIKGGDGNTEYLVCFSLGGAMSAYDEDISQLVKRVTDNRV